jgi:hypothetical protein
MTINSKDAENLLEWAHSQNPGPWADHSRVAARAAKTIADSCNIDSEAAYIYGLLHDIGRYEGVRGMHHAIAGFRLMKEKQCDEVAQICLTHSFNVQDINAYSGKNDCTEEETAWLRETLNGIMYDDYDHLIQLCDAICLPQGVCLLQVRLMDVARRYGLNDLTLKKWDAHFALKQLFDEKCGKNIYDLFYDEVREISFQCL